MNKQALIEKVAAKAEISKALAAKVIDAALDATVEAAQKGEGLQLVGFASLSIANKPARKGKNPRTGEVINIPARTVVRIKPGSRFAL